MKGCLGILAHNEEGRISRTVEDVLQQSIWTQPNFDAEIIVIVNGSSDATAREVRDALSTTPIPHQVIELERPGKANAWNQLIHEFAHMETDIFILADADIRLPDPDTLKKLVDELTAHPHAVAAVDLPVKDLSLQSRKGLGTRMSLSASELAHAGPPKLCGQLYAARASALRGIFLPEPLLVEDGWIKAMLTTCNFSKPENSTLLVRPAGTYHLYEAETKLSSIYRHEKRIFIGTLCNFLLFEKAKALVAAGQSPGQALQQESFENPDWFRDLIQEKLGKRLSRKDLQHLVCTPLRQLRSLNTSSALKKLPAALVRTTFNFGVAVGAVHDLKKGKIRW
jgi:hypothetical protein